MYDREVDSYIVLAAGIHMYHSIKSRTYYLQFSSVQFLVFSFRSLKQMNTLILECHLTNVRHEILASPIYAN